MTTTTTLQPTEEAETKAAAQLLTDDAKAIQAAVVTWKHMDRLEKNDVVPFIRVAKMFKSDRRKLILSMGAYTDFSKCLRQVLVRNLKQRPEWDMKTGRPPAGHMERELAAWLKAMLDQ